jgi:hypothetical protein
MNFLLYNEVMEHNISSWIVIYELQLMIFQIQILMDIIISGEIIMDSHQILQLDKPERVQWIQFIFHQNFLVIYGVLKKHELQKIICGEILPIRNGLDNDHAQHDGMCQVEPTGQI